MVDNYFRYFLAWRPVPFLPLGDLTGNWQNANEPGYWRISKQKAREMLNIGNAETMLDPDDITEIAIRRDGIMLIRTTRQMKIPGVDDKALRAEQTAELIDLSDQKGNEDTDTLMMLIDKVKTDYGHYHIFHAPAGRPEEQLPQKPRTGRDSAIAEVNRRVRIGFVKIEMPDDLFEKELVDIIKDDKALCRLMSSTQLSTGGPKKVTILPSLLLLRYNFARVFERACEHLGEGDARIASRIPLLDLQILGVQPFKRVSADRKFGSMPLNEVTLGDILSPLHRAYTDTNKELWFLLRVWQTIALPIRWFLNAFSLRQGERPWSRKLDKKQREEKVTQWIMRLNSNWPKISAVVFSMLLIVGGFFPETRSINVHIASIYLLLCFLILHPRYRFTRDQYIFFIKLARNAMGVLEFGNNLDRAVKRIYLKATNDAEKTVSNAFPVESFDTAVKILSVRLERFILGQRLDLQWLLVEHAFYTAILAVISFQQRFFETPGVEVLQSLPKVLGGP